MLVVAGILLNACAPRSQMVLFVDTDAPLVGQLRDRPELSPDAAVDVLRVDALDDRGQIFDVCEYIVSDPTAWPLSFGVVRPPGDADAPVRLRLRLFHRAFADTDSLSGITRICGEEVSPAAAASVHRPEAGLTIDRVLLLLPPHEDITRVWVRLALDCMGVPASFLDPATTCVDGAKLHSSPEEGVAAVADPKAVPLSLGTASSALITPCTSAQPANTRCIPGGLSIMGDRHFFGFKNPLLQGRPLRAVRLRPFFTDRDEFTLERMRPMVARLPEPPRKAGDAGVVLGQFCTWQDNAPGRLPVNCVSWQAAQAACKLVGGDLPSEAQWDYVARGRDEHRTFPWGEAEASCCTASLERRSIDGIEVHCSGMGPEVVGSHSGEGCAGGGDVSRDDIRDLGGSMTEYLLDDISAFEERCGLEEGLTLDPVCRSRPGDILLARGSDWSAGNNTAYTAWRRTVALGVATGFRCVYPGVP